MWQWFRRKRQQRAQEEAQRDPVFAALANGRCPDCGHTEFIHGPQGGMNLNIKCARCGSYFNIAGWAHNLIHAERIDGHW